jgi:Diacylglycerol kinase accessory domain
VIQNGVLCIVLLPPTTSTSIYNETIYLYDHRAWCACHHAVRVVFNQGWDCIHARFDRVDGVDELQNMISAGEYDLPSSCQDGYLDVVSIRRDFHLGQIKLGLSNAQRLCKCREATIIIKDKVAVQLDGEPWHQNAC